MSQNPTLLRALGLFSLAVFGLMVVVLQLKIAPNVSFLPQAELGNYSDGDLAQLAQELRDQGLVGVYKTVLLGLDTLFIVIFALWAILAHVFRGIGLRRWIGFGLVVAYVALDFGENTMLATRLDLLGSGFVPALPINPVSVVHYVTFAKYTAFACCLLSVFFVSRRFS